jgi:Arc/MetJ-type ribon-helix-helix transcriptional regulator
VKPSANVPNDVMGFVDQQVTDGHYPFRSAAVTEAIVLWRVHRLTSSYG